MLMLMTKIHADMFLDWDWFLPINFGFARSARCSKKIFRSLQLMAMGRGVLLLCGQNLFSSAQNQYWGKGITNVVLKTPTFKFNDLIGFLLLLSSVCVIIIMILMAMMMILYQVVLHANETCLPRNLTIIFSFLQSGNFCARHIFLRWSVDLFGGVFTVQCQMVSGGGRLVSGGLIFLGRGLVHNLNTLHYPTRGSWTTLREGKRKEVQGYDLWPNEGGSSLQGEETTFRWSMP